ncbi:proton-conducting transporter transmembrane domain-containing protein [Amnibacterium sp.]|uniref:proton-conducting transporter transmembrane domain-containing protein n=1 Tax=Amnibacterium sp. TaxID=1872496 RepID=UPI003F7C954B
MNAALLWCVLVFPLGATVLSIFAPRVVNQAATVVAALVSFVVTIALIPVVSGSPLTAPPLLRLDAVSEVFLLGTTFLYAVVSIYSIGYFVDDRRAAHGKGRGHPFDRYSRRFSIGINAFAFSMICAPAVNGLALLWVAIEITTVVSALLVAIDGTDGASEAAWKYILIASSGLGIALLATILLYYAGAQALGPSFDLEFDPLIGAARRLPAQPVELAFVLAVVGFGTKVGLFPVHTWLPDAHAEAPTPVSALLSGALLATSFYAVVRYFQVAIRTLGPAFPRTLLLVFGLLSLLLAALYLFGQQHIKRMLAYSSVEHMGILAIGVGFGTPLALSGVMLHVLAHAAGKGTAFMGAGVLVHKSGTKLVSGIRGGLDLLPFSAPFFLVAVLALAALPPFGIFRSEFEIVAGGVASGNVWISGAFVVLVVLAFVGLTRSTTGMLFSSAPSDAVRGEPSAWMVVPAAAGVVALLVLGLHPPEPLTVLIQHAAAQIGGSR